MRGCVGGAVAPWRHTHAHTPTHAHTHAHAARTHARTRRHQLAAGGGLRGRRGRRRLPHASRVAPPDGSQPAAAGIAARRRVCGRPWRRRRRRRRAFRRVQQRRVPALRHQRQPRRVAVQQRLAVAVRGQPAAVTVGRTEPGDYHLPHVPDMPGACVHECGEPTLCLSVCVVSCLFARVRVRVRVSSIDLCDFACVRMVATPSPAFPLCAGKLRDRRRREDAAVCARLPRGLHRLLAAPQERVPGVHAACDVTHAETTMGGGARAVSGGCAAPTVNRPGHVAVVVSEERRVGWSRVAPSVSTMTKNNSGVAIVRVRACVRAGACVCWVRFVALGGGGGGCVACGDSGFCFYSADWLRCRFPCRSLVVPEAPGAAPAVARGRL
jgi:hypothetical protein